MRLAYKIQTDLLPGEAPVIDGYDLAGRSIPAKTVGGDYFDFIPLEEHRLAVCLGDVVGKGMPAALLMANLQATLRAQAVDASTAEHCIRRSNRLMFNSTDVDKFVTLFYGILCSETHELRYCNAGHNYPIHVRANGDTSRLTVGGLVLGALEDFDFREAAIPLEPDDVLVVFSDGISEATNENGDEFGEDHLAEIVRLHRGESAARIIESVMQAVREHTGDGQQSDDITIVVIKRLPLVHRPGSS
jgi:sigma-B regulation protein RsbU (phosphoserine phosphatase)